MNRSFVTSFLVILGMIASSVQAGFDINSVVTRGPQFDQIDLFVLNRDTQGTYNDRGDTGTGFFGASLMFRLEAGHRAYFAVRRVEFGDRVDFPNPANLPGKSWLRIGTAETTFTGGSLPSPNTFPFDTNPWAAGLDSFNIAWGHTANGVPADTGLGAHVARLVVDPRSELRIWGFLTGSYGDDTASIPEANAYFISTVPEPLSFVALAIAAPVALRRHRKPIDARS